MEHGFSSSNHQLDHIIISSYCLPRSRFRCRFGLIGDVMYGDHEAVRYIRIGGFCIGAGHIAFPPQGMLPGGAGRFFGRGGAAASASSDQACD